MPHAVVVGGGLSGLSAAHTLINAGTSVTLLEKNAFLGGNSTKATSGINGAGSRTQAKMNIPDSKASFLEDTVRSATGQKTGPMPDPYPLAEVITENSADAVHWIQDNFGLALDTVSRLGGHTHQRTHRSLHGGKFPGMEITSALMKRYEQLADKEDGTCSLIINSVAKKLLRDASGRVNGIEYTNGEGTLISLPADAVILATGGYGAGGAVVGSLLEKVRPDLMHLPTTNGDHSQGDGITLAMDIGAKAVGLKHVQVHPTGLVNPDAPNARTKFLAAEALRGEGGILLDNEGNRFCNDIGKRDYVTGCMWKLNKGPYRLVLNSAAASKLEWHCKHYVSRRVMKKMASGADLAKEMGIPTKQLQASFDTYNEYAKAGKPDPFGKVYFTNAPFHTTDSFFVSIVTPVVHYTMGGLAISPEAECVDAESSRTIPGLYCAGEAAGGVHGRNRLGGSALLECVVFGRVAGAAAQKFIASGASKAVGGGGMTITIPQPNGAAPITVSYGSGGASAPVGKLIEINEWNDAITTEVGKLTSGADGVVSKSAPAAPATPTAAATPAPAAAEAVEGQDVAVVYGSFFMGDSERDATNFVNIFPKDSKLAAPVKAITGNEFNFNSLAKTKFLVVATSSMYGNPPKEFWKFYAHLKEASMNPNKPLKGLQHAVYGNGDETYIDTYMNVPRMVDQLLEKAGSRRFFARGETGEPCTPIKEDAVEAAVWGEGMWKAMATAKASAPGVTWDAHWEGTEPNHHQDVTDWDMKKIQKKFGKLLEHSIFAALAPPSKL